MTGIRALSGRINVPMTVRLLVGGVLVALVVTILPVLSTSGQHQIHTISTLFASLGAGALFALAGILMAFFPARLLPLELVVTLLAWGAMRATAAVSAAVKRRMPVKTPARS